MATVNIRRDVSDGFYRYKMPQLQTKVEGKGNGIKTVLPNISDIAKSLSRPPTYPTKFFGCELGAQTVFDEKADRYIVNGAHDAPRLRELLFVFIEKFVLCGSCKNPETDLIITKDESVLRECKACGKRQPVDMRHKLVTFILRNPPPKPKKEKIAGEAGSKSNKKSSKKNGGGEMDEIAKSIEGGALNIDDRDADNEDWSVDTSKEAVAERLQKLTGVQGSMVVDPSKATNGSASPDNNKDGEEDEEAHKFEEFAQHVSQNKDASDIDLYKRAKEVGIEKNHKTVLALMQGLLEDDDPFPKLKEHETLFQKLVTSEKHQKSVLGGIERYFGEKQPQMMNSVPKMLIFFYQADILEDEVIEYWGTHASKKYVDKDVSKKVRKSAAPFLKWLEEADSE